MLELCHVALYAKGIWWLDNLQSEVDSVTIDKEANEPECINE